MSEFKPGAYAEDGFCSCYPGRVGASSCGIRAHREYRYGGDRLVPSERFVVPLEDPNDALGAIVDAFWDEAKSAGKETPDGRALVLTRTFLDDLAERIAAGLIKGTS